MSKIWTMEPQPRADAKLRNRRLGLALSLLALLYIAAIILFIVEY